MKYILLFSLLFPFTAHALEHPLVCAVAEYRLTQIQTNWSHNGFYEKGAIRKVYDQIGHTRANWLPRGVWRENLARKFQTKDAVYAAWQKSPAHKANLFAPSDYSCLRTASDHWVLITFKAT
jgi:hypothetical protein